MGKKHIRTTDTRRDGVGSSPPLFLVRNKDNVNAQLHRARGLITMWDFLVYKGRVGMTQIILQRKDEYSTLKIMPAKCRSRYFDDGRLYVVNQRNGTLLKPNTLV